MFKKISVLAVMLITACAVETNPNFKDSSDALVEDESIWICHSPGSKHHGKQCDESSEPGQCLVAGDNSKFCWQLLLSDCDGDAGLLYNEICDELN
jgi:hypothetical protein